MTKIAKIKNNDIFTDSIVIAKGTKNEHESIVRLIDNYSEELKKFGNIRFTDLKSGNSKGGRPIKIYELNESQATFLMTLLRNSDKVVQFKLSLTKEFFKLRDELFKKAYAKSGIEEKHIVNKNQDKILYSVLEVAKILMVNKNKVYDLMNSGELKYLKLGRKKVPKRCLEEFIYGNIMKDISNPWDIKCLEVGENDN